MTLAVSVPLVLALGAAILILHKVAGLRLWHAVICALFGFYLATTAAAPAVRDFIDGLVQAFTG